jgi:hypothetical protein
MNDGKFISKTAHNLKVVGSNPAPATKQRANLSFFDYLLKIHFSTYFQPL